MPTARKLISRQSLAKVQLLHGTNGTPKFVVINYIEALRVGLERMKDAKSAADMKRYLRGQFDFYGVSTVPRRQIHNHV